MNHVTEELELYSLGALTPADRARVAAHLVECPACREQARAIDEVVQELPETLPDRDLSQEVSALFALVLPGLVPTEVLAKLDISHYRAEHLLAAARSSGGEPAPVPTS